MKVVDPGEEATNIRVEVGPTPESCAVEHALPVKDLELVPKVRVRH